MSLFFTREAALLALGCYFAAATLPRPVAVPAAAAVVLVLAGMGVEAGPLLPVFAPFALVGGSLVVFLATAPRTGGAR